MHHFLGTGTTLNHGPLSKHGWGAVCWVGRDVPQKRIKSTPPCCVRQPTHKSSHLTGPAAGWSPEDAAAGSQGTRWGHACPCPGTHSPPALQKGERQGQHGGWTSTSSPAPPPPEEGSPTLRLPSDPYLLIKTRVKTSVDRWQLVRDRMQV